VNVKILEVQKKSGGMRYAIVEFRTLKKVQECINILNGEIGILGSINNIKFKFIH